MNKAFTILIATSLSTIAPIVAAAQAQLPPVIVTEADNGQSRPVQVRQVVEIRLPYTPSTGYSWTTPAGKGVRQLRAPVKKPGVGIGASGTITFFIAATTVGAHVVTTTSRQPWQGGGKGKTFTITLVAGVKG